MLMQVWGLESGRSIAPKYWQKRAKNTAKQGKFAKAARLRTRAPNWEWLARDNQGGRKQVCDERLFEFRRGRSETPQACARCRRLESPQNGREATRLAFAECSPNSNTGEARREVSRMLHRGVHQDR